MRHLNYNHLFYFWSVSREGSIAKASEVLHITPQTISGQLKLLEDSVGENLFHRNGRRLSLTETGQTVNLFADEIFTLGAELSQRVRSKSTGISTDLNIGILNSIPKLIALRTIKPSLELEEDIKAICREGNLEDLLSDLAVHRLDLILSDRPIPTGLNVKAYSHKLGESKIGFFVTQSELTNYVKNFPNSLTNAPILLPTATNELRRSLNDWFDQHNITPKIIAEFDDSALLKAFAKQGIGVFPAPLAISEQIETMYNCKLIGAADSLKETYYAISPERKLKHPGVITITEYARENIFD